ncbi:MAG: hypothetical protein FJ149_09150 [Euryarchaeota archaeon]|nr:hypothetical protein [Euryarchaeota archaeon]
MLPPQDCVQQILRLLERRGLEDPHELLPQAAQLAGELEPAPFPEGLVDCPLDIWLWLQPPTRGHLATFLYPAYDQSFASSVSRRALSENLRKGVRFRGRTLMVLPHLLQRNLWTRVFVFFLLK